MRSVLSRPLAALMLALVTSCAANGNGSFGGVDDLGGGDAGRGPGADAPSSADGAAAPDVPGRPDVPSMDAPAPDGEGPDVPVKGGDGGGPADGSPGDAGAPDGAAPSDGGPATCRERETCDNGLDDDCDGMTDEGCACVPGTTQRCYDGPLAQAGRGVCVWGTQRCEGVGEFGSWGACAGAGRPMPVECGRGMDFRCNGNIDEGCSCAVGMTRQCYSGPSGTMGVGACRAGTQTCAMTPEGSAWGPCEGEALPAMRDLCDGVDRDCDGNPNTGCGCVRGQTRPCYTGPAGTQGVGSCRAGTQSCEADATGGTAWGACGGQTLPAARDACDGVDRDCDGNPNTGCACTVGMSRACYSGPAATRGVGSCRAGSQRCVATSTGAAWEACSGEVLPARDACDGVDRDCDGNPNTGCACTRGQTRTCYTGPAGTQGVGICRGGYQACVASGSGAAWGPCMDEVLPLADRCDGVDRDCDGNLNTGCACTLGQTRACYSGPAGTMGVGRCRGGTQGCEPGSSGRGTMWGACAGEVAPAASETCGNGVDDNCNGMADEGCTRVCPDGYDLMNDPMNCGRCGNACGATQACAGGVCVGGGQLRISMVWNRAGDMDLHVVPPCGTEIYFGRLSACGGTLDRDDIPGTGPENVFWAGTPASGTYLVCATPYGISGATNFTVTVNRGTTELRRWTGTRATRSGYVACSASSPYYLGSFTWP